MVECALVQAASTDRLGTHGTAAWESRPVSVNVAAMTPAVVTDARVQVEYPEVLVVGTGQDERFLRVKSDRGNEAAVAANVRQETTRFVVEAGDAVAISGQDVPTGGGEAQIVQEDTVVGDASDDSSALVDYLHFLTPAASACQELAVGGKG